MAAIYLDNGSSLTRVGNNVIEVASDNTQGILGIVGGSSPEVKHNAGPARDHRAVIAKEETR